MSDAISKQEKQSMTRVVKNSYAKKRRWAEEESGYDQRRLDVYLFDLEKNTQAELKRIKEM